MMNQWCQVQPNERASSGLNVGRGMHVKLRLLHAERRRSFLSL